VNGYGEQQYGPPPGYGPPQGYGPPPGYGYPYQPQPQPWPYGPGRPGSATAAAVLGFVTGGLTIAVLLVMLVAVLGGQSDSATWVLLLLGVPCAAGLISGAAELMRRRTTGVLFGAAASSVAVLVLGLVVGLLELETEDVIGLAVFVVLALPLPLLTAIFAKVGTVTGWVAAAYR
jgi:hypothetical protein